MAVIKEAPLSEAEVKELQKLKNNPDVALARKEARIRYAAKQKLYVLRSLKKRGEAIRNNPDYADLIAMLEEDEEYGGDEE